ncbi:MAG TPA: M48 family metallopeptidase, partial [Phytomonospora sp.]
MPRGKTTVRAAVSLALLAGFYVYALAVAGALFGLGVLAFDVFGGLLSLKILLATGGAALAVFAGLAAALRRGAEGEPGVPVSRSDAPALWEFVDDTARRVATRTADTLRLLPEVNAAVGEETGLLGLTGGRRTLYLGVPVAAGLSAGELRAILAHEFGHYAAVHTRLTALSHRGRMAIGHVVGRLRRRAPLVAWVFKPYTALYLAVQSAVSRGQEREADRVAVRIAGAEAAIGAFTGLHLLDLAVDRFLDAEVGCGQPFGLVPRGVWTGFGSYLDEHGTELRALAEETPYPGPGLFSTHPPVGERIAFFERAGGEPEAPDTGRARDLLPETLWASPELDALAVEPGDGEPLAWDEFGPTVFWAVQRNLADAGYRQIARVTGTPSLAAVLDQYGDAERARRWYRAYVDPAFPSGGMGGIVLTAAHEAGALTCRHRWGDWLVVRPDGTELDMEGYFDRVDVALADL